MQAQFVTIDGVRIRLLRAGTGLPLLLLHPVGHSADVFIRNIDRLAERFTVIAPDLPGHGFADGIDFGGDAPQVATATQMLRLMSHLGHERFDLLGSSYGGLVAAVMALNAPEQIRSLCVVGSATTFSSQSGQEQTLRAVKANAATAMQSPTLEACRARMGNICFDHTKVAEEVLPLQVTYYALPDRFSRFEETIEALIEGAASLKGRVHDRLDQITQRALLIVGRNDIRAGWEMHVQAASRMREARCVVFEECGHLPYMEHPEQFNETVLEFLNH